MLLSTVVVSYGRPWLLRDCLRSLGPALAAVDADTETLVVENGAADGCIQVVAQELPEAAVIALPSNRGYAGGVNAGLSRARGEFVLVLNNDVVVAPDAVSESLKHARRDPRVGSVATQMRFASDGSTINSAGIEVDRLGVASDRLLGHPAEAGEVTPREVFGASGAAALYRRAMLEELGGLDESFFAFLEDVDLAWRARMAGWGALYVPSAIVYHHHSVTAGHGSDFKYFHVGRNRVRLIAKNMERGRLLRSLPAMLAYDLGYVAFAVLTDRTLAPLLGRARGLREWRTYARQGAGRRRLVLAPAGGPRAALRRRATWARASNGVMPRSAVEARRHRRAGARSSHAG